MKSFNLALVLISTLGILAITLGVIFFFSNNQVQTQEVTVNIDETVIIQKITDLARLETLEMTIQRDLEVNLDLGGLNFIGREIFDNSARREYAVTGFVTAGVDLSNLSDEDVSISEDGKTLEINLPAPQILSVEIDADKTQITNEDFSFLFNLNNLNPNQRRETNEELLRQAIKQSREALRDGACNDEILPRASENARNIVQNLFLFANLEEVKVNLQEAENCGFEIS